jgi:phenylacetate-CoA ligase
MFSNAVYRSSPLWLQERMIAWRTRLRNSLREGQKFRQRLEEARATQWYSEEQLRAYQEANLRQLLAHAQARVPYYRELFGRLSMTPAELGLDDLPRIPLLDKRTVLQQGKRMIAEGYGALRISINTSGSTGAPLRILQDLNAVVREHAFLWRQLEWAGFKRGERRAWIRGDMIVPVEERDPPFWRLDRADNMLMMSSYHLSESSAESYVRALADFDPVIIHAYPSSIAFLARFMEAKGRYYRGRRLRGVVTSSETLTDSDRGLIESRFGCRTFDQYGNGERAALVQTCEHGTRHLAVDYATVELLPVGDGLYEMIGTGFNNWVTPFVRYRTGDTVELAASPCPCRRKLPAIVAIHGRMDEYVRTPDGRRIGRLDHIFKGIRRVAEGQIVQEQLHELVIRVVPFGDFGEDDRAKLIANARERVGTQMRVTVEVVAEIPRGNNGKFRAVVSKVA